MHRQPIHRFEGSSACTSERNTLPTISTRAQICFFNELLLTIVIIILHTTYYRQDAAQRESLDSVKAKLEQGSFDASSYNAPLREAFPDLSDKKALKKAAKRLIVEVSTYLPPCLKPFY